MKKKITYLNIKHLTSLIAFFIILSFCAGWKIEKYANNKPSKNKQNIKEAVFDPAYIDTSYKPCDDFYLYSNGNWLKNNPVPEQYSRYSSFEKLQEKNLIQIHDLLMEAALNKENTDFLHKQIGLFYATGTDSAKIEQQGISYIQDYIYKIDSIKSIPDLITQVASFHTMGINSIFYTFPGQDVKNSNVVITQLSQGGLSLPDRDYYTSEEFRSSEIRKSYLKYIKDMFILIGNNVTVAENNATIVLKIETNLANASLTLLEQRNPERIYNKTDVIGLQKTYPNIEWIKYFSTIGLSPNDINVRQIDYFKAVNNLLKEIPIKDWKIYLKWNLINESADFLSNQFAEKKFTFFNTILSGNTKIQEKWKRVLNTANSILGEAIGQLYVEKYFSPEAKKKMTLLVKNLKEALGEHITKLTWMTEATKKQALEKLDAMTLKIGYPDKWKDYSGLVLKNESFITNVFLVKKFNFKHELSRINKLMDRARWSMPPQTINAYYSNNLNEIIFPAGILQPPFFDPNADDALNYGSIGVVIGHEMTHGFDDQGKNYDKSGNLNNWWKEEDIEKFNNLTGLLVDHFDKYILLDSLHINGRLTLGENIADLGGISISLTALKKSLQNTTVQVKIDGFSPYQRFFLAYAQFWKLNIREKELMRRIKEDVHSTSEARVNGIVYNIPEFYETFGLNIGKRYIIPEKRIKIW